jgi:ABC-2 type transport system ATP-binding protein
MLNNSIVFDIKDLRIAYGLIKAVDNLSLRLEQGQSLALLGLNGAGKTSTIRVLLGMMKAKGGETSVLGEPAGNVSKFAEIGYAPEEATPPEFLTGDEYLDFIGGFKIKDRAARKKEVSNLLSFFELDPHKAIRAYSKGMRRRVVLAQALIGNPALLILDEPFNGLDPILIKKLRERLEDYCKKGGSLLLSSHILAEVEKICDHIAVIHKGVVKRFTKTSELVQEFGNVEEAFTKLVGDN